MPARGRCGEKSLRCFKKEKSLWNRLDLWLVLGQMQEAF